MKMPEEKIFWKKIIQNGHNTCPTSLFNRRGCGLMGFAVEEAVCHWGDKAELSCCSPNYCQVVQAAQMNYSLD